MLTAERSSSASVILSAAEPCARRGLGAVEGPAIAWSFTPTVSAKASICRTRNYRWPEQDRARSLEAPAATNETNHPRLHRCMTHPPTTSH